MFGRLPTCRRSVSKTILLDADLSSPDDLLARKRRKDILAGEIVDVELVAAGARDTAHAVTVRTLHLNRRAIIPATAPLGQEAPAGDAASITMTYERVDAAFIARKAPEAQ